MFKLVLQRKPFAFVIFFCWANATHVHENGSAHPHIQKHVHKHTYRSTCTHVKLWLYISISIWLIDVYLSYAVCALQTMQVHVYNDEKRKVKHLHHVRKGRLT